MEPKDKIRLNSVNSEHFKKNSSKNLNLKKRLISGIIWGLVVGGGVAITNYTTSNIDNNIEFVNETPIDVDIKDVNSLNIILNNDNCSEVFFNEVQSHLTNDGIDFNISDRSNNIDFDDCVIVTLDQQYISGPGMAIITTMNNEQRGYSDELSLAMETGFNENGFFTNGIVAGKIGYTEDELGNVIDRIPTEAENAIGNGRNSSLVTLSFGTENNNAELVANSIENGLARYSSYLNNNTLDKDLLYSAINGDSLDEIATKFNVTTSELNIYNKLDSNNLNVLPGDTFANPAIKEIKEFDKSVPVNLYVEKTMWHH